MVNHTVDASNMIDDNSNNLLFICIYNKIALDKLGGGSKQDTISKKIASTTLTNFPSIYPAIRACLFIMKKSENFVVFFLVLTEQA